MAVTLQQYEGFRIGSSALVSVCDGAIDKGNNFGGNGFPANWTPSDPENYMCKLGETTVCQFATYTPDSTGSTYNINILYLYIDGLVDMFGGIQTIFTILGVMGQIWLMKLTSTGTLKLYDANNVLKDTSGIIIADQTWYRFIVLWQYVNAGNFKFYYYSNPPKTFTVIPNINPVFDEAAMDMDDGGGGVVTLAVKGATVVGINPYTVYVDSVLDYTLATKAGDYQIHGASDFEILDGFQPDANTNFSDNGTTDLSLNTWADVAKTPKEVQTGTIPFANKTGYKICDDGDNGRPIGPSGNAWVTGKIAASKYILRKKSRSADCYEVHGTFNGSSYSIYTSGLLGAGAGYWVIYNLTGASYCQTRKTYAVLGWKSDIAAAAVEELWCITLHAINPYTYIAPSQDMVPVLRHYNIGYLPIEPLATPEIPLLEYIPQQDNIAELIANYQRAYQQLIPPSEANLADIYSRITLGTHHKQPRVMLTG